MRRTSAKPERCFRLGVGLLALVVCAAYGSVIFAHYAYADDFMTLYAVRSKDLSDRLSPFHNVQGRPLGGWIMETVFRAAWTIGGLDKVRVACLGLALFCGAILAAEFRRVTPWWVGLGAASLLLLDPATAVAVAWPSNGLLSLPAAVLALLGGVGWRRAFERGEVRSPGFWLQIASGGGMGLAALLIYQPCACFFLLPAAIRLLDKNDAREALRAGAWTSGGFTVLSAGYFAVFQLVRPHLAKAEEIVMHRADMMHDLTGRLRFYLGDVLPRSFESWTVFFGTVPERMALCAAGLCALPFLVRLARTPGGASVRLQAFLVVPVLFGLASSPLLVVKGDYAPFRTLAVLYGLVVVGVAGGVAEISGWASANRTAARAVLAAVWAGLIAANAVVAACITKEALVMRSVREMDLYRAFVRLRLADYPREVIVLLPDRKDLPRLTGLAPQHEFGTASSNDDFNFPGLVYFAFQEEYQHGPSAGGTPSDAEIVVHKVSVDGSGLFPPDVPVIDAIEALNGSGRSDPAPRSGPVTEDRFLGQVQQLTPALQLSRWLGLYEMLSPTRISHRELGPMELAGAGGNDCWFHREGIGWFWTSQTSFPFIYSSERKHWLWYVRGTKNPPEMYDFDEPGKPPVPLK